jgi:AcrR family transcriptional regulator
VADGDGGRQNRLERRKQQTRAALIKAAQAFIAAGKLNVPVLDITQAADVGMGSFYNHFDSKEELFQAAVTDVFDAHGALLDSLPEVEDPAETFARSFRLTGRLFRRRPQESRVLLNVGLGPAMSERGLAPRALRDIIAANRAGRFRVADPQLALAMATGVLLALGQLVQDQPERDDAQASDQMAEDLLCIFGVPAAEAHEICCRPLPDIAGITGDGSAARWRAPVIPRSGPHTESGPLSIARHLPVQPQAASGISTMSPTSTPLG